MKTRSKRYRETVESIKDSSDTQLEDAVRSIELFGKVKFDETVEVSVTLGVDPKQSSNAVRGTVNLPHGSGKEVKVLVFTENAEEAISRGADYAALRIWFLK